MAVYDLTETELHDTLVGDGISDPTATQIVNYLNSSTDVFSAGSPGNPGYKSAYRHRAQYTRGFGR